MAEGSGYTWPEFPQNQGFVRISQVWSQNLVQETPLGPRQMRPAIGFAPEGPYEAIPAESQPRPFGNQWFQQGNMLVSEPGSREPEWETQQPTSSDQGKPHQSPPSDVQDSINEETSVEHSSPSSPLVSPLLRKLLQETMSSPYRRPPTPTEQPQPSTSTRQIKDEPQPSTSKQQFEDDLSHAEMPEPEYQKLVALLAAGERQEGWASTENSSDCVYDSKYWKPAKLADLPWQEVKEQTSHLPPHEASQIKKHRLKELRRRASKRYKLRTKEQKIRLRKLEAQESYMKKQQYRLQMLEAREEVMEHQRSLIQAQATQIAELKLQVTEMAELKLQVAELAESKLQVTKLTTEKAILANRLAIYDQRLRNACVVPRPHYP